MAMGGTHLGSFSDEDSHAYTAAVEKAIDLGINFVDTAVNYRSTLVHEFYEHSLQLSQRNLGLRTLDIHYIHNPEVSRRVLGETAFYRGLEALIAWYERKVEEGCIRHYGMATWWGGLVADPASEWHMSLEKVLAVVRAVAGGEHHHFRFVQMPFNLTNSKAKDEATQEYGGEKVTQPSMQQMN